MEMGSPPLGPIAKLLRWSADFVAMPSRIRVIAGDVAADRDPRPVCLSCGEGRVGSVKREPTNGFDRIVGTCEKCGAGWILAKGGIAGPL